MKANISIRQEMRKYLPLLILPILFSLLLYGLVRRDMTQQMEQSAKQTLDLFYQQVSTMTLETESVAHSLISDLASLDRSDGGNLPFSYEDAASLCRQLEIRKNGSSYIDRVYFVCFPRDTIYSDTGYFTYGSLPGILDGLQLSVDAFLHIDAPYWNMSTIGLLREPFYVAPYHNEDGEIVGRLLFTISLNRFIETISALDADFVCLYADNFMISSHPISEPLTEQVLGSDSELGRVLGEPVKCFRVEKGNYHCVAARASKDYYTPLRTMFLGFAVYALLVFLFGFVYLYRVSKKRSQNLTALIKALPQQGNDAADAAPQGLVPAVQAALLRAAEATQSQKEILRSHRFYDLLRRSYPASTVREYAADIGIPEASEYCLARFSIRGWDNVAAAASSREERHRLAWTIFQTVAADTKAAPLQLLCEDDTECYHALFCGEISQNPGLPAAVCEQICSFFRKEYGIDLRSSLSQTSTALSALPELYVQVQRLEAFSQSINNNAAVISEKLLIEQSGSYVTGNFFRQNLTLSSTLLAKKYDVIPSMVAAILQEHVTNNPDYDLGIRRLKAVGGTLAEGVLAIQGVDLDLPLFARRLREINTVSEMNADVEFIFQQLNEAVAAPTSFREVDAACAYIEKKLADKNLNVSMISEAVGTIPQRLIPMFQKQLGMGIAEYVNAQRIEKAVQLLTTTKLKVNQISDRVGYSNTDTFTRNFRKLLGSTPTEYRQISM